MARIRYFRRVRAAPHVAGITPPVNTVLPVITGSVAGEESSTSDGTWTGSSTFTYQWYLDGVLLEGETADAITTDAGWVGQTLTVTVFAGNGAGLVGATAAGVALTEGSEYTGPLDLVPGAVIGRSQRSLSAAYVGNAIRIRRSSDDSLQTFTCASGNAVDTAAVATFLGGSNPFVARYYDQVSSANDLIQATAIAQPIWLSSANGGKPGLESSDNAEFLKTASPVTLTAPCTIFIVAASAETNASVFWGESGGFNNFATVGNAGGGVASNFNDSDNSYSVGGAFTYAVNAAYHIHEVVVAFGANTYTIDGVALSGDNSNDQDQNPSFLADLYFGGENFEFYGVEQECIVWPGVLSAGNRTLIRQNIATYYGITLT